MLDANNDWVSGQNLRPIGCPWSCFSRTTILAGGQLVEGIDMCHRVRDMFSFFSVTDSREMCFWLRIFTHFRDTNYDSEAIVNILLIGSPMYSIYACSTTAIEWNFTRTHTFTNQIHAIAVWVVFSWYCNSSDLKPNYKIHRFSYYVYSANCIFRVVFFACFPLKVDSLH